jgi:hypothetical protein
VCKGRGKIKGGKEVTEGQGKKMGGRRREGTERKGEEKEVIHHTILAIAIPRSTACNCTRSKFCSNALNDLQLLSSFLAFSA